MSRIDEIRAKGLANGYPECCVEEFISDIDSQAKSAEERGLVVVDDQNQYVPCTSCLFWRPGEWIPFSSADEAMRFKFLQEG